MEKIYLAIWMWLCDGKLKVKIADFRLPSPSQKRAILIKLPSLGAKGPYTRRRLQNTCFHSV